MITFRVTPRGLLLTSSPDFASGRWIWEDLKTHGKVRISRVFTFERGDLFEEPDEAHEGMDEFEYVFRLATRDVGYFRIPGRVFEIPNDVLIADSGIKIERKLFVAERNVSIFGHLADVVGTEEAIVVGGDRPDGIPVEVFSELLSKFPNTIELNRYANARVANIVGGYFDGMRDFRTQYEAYLSRRKSVPAAALGTFRPKELLEAEISKFILVRDTISEWLASSKARTEKEWQRLILQFILLIFPKYVAVLENVQLEDRYSKPGATTDRYIDIVLVDASGNLDVIEIKRPFDDILLARTRYRDNFVPTKELSGTIMQAEKYLFHLSKWGVAGEAKLTKAHREQLPPGMSIRVTNPKAMLILGRDRKPDGSSALDAGQMFDLEVIKRKYANMIDIITYDDLLRRLDNIIASLRRRAVASKPDTPTPGPKAETAKGPRGRGVG
jgi:hypothetical protein